MLPVELLEPHFFCVDGIESIVRRRTHRLYGHPGLGGRWSGKPEAVSCARSNKGLWTHRHDDDVSTVYQRGVGLTEAGSSMSAILALPVRGSSSHTA